MWLFKLFIVGVSIASGALSVEAADLEMKVVDKNCWVEVFDDSDYDVKNAHIKLQGPKEYATLKNAQVKDWNNDIESVIVGPNATVRAYPERDFKGQETVFASGQRVPKLSKVGMSNDIESMKITCENIIQSIDPSSSMSTTTITTPTAPAP